jgi:transcriptional regulator with XRE-family HTH domain
MARATADLAKKIRQLRERRDLTQQAAAEAAEIEVKHWQLLEAGTRANPTLATLLAVARALDVEVHELLHFSSSTQQRRGT